MNLRPVQIAALAGAALFCFSSFGQTWDRTGSGPYFICPTGTGTGTLATYKVGIGSTANLAQQLYVLAQQTALTPLVCNTQPSPTVDVARFQVNGTTKVAINKLGHVLIADGAPSMPDAVQLQLGGSTTSADQIIRLNYSGNVWWDIKEFQSDARFALVDGSGLERLTFKNTYNGNCGFNIANPTHTLDINTPNGSGVVIGPTYAGSSAGAGCGLLVENRVGIGTSSPDANFKLQVVGGIKTDKIQINNWTLEAPDYVFDKGYKLRSIGEVEKFIAAQKHLPEIASAKEMKEKGVDLVKMNMTLLQKVEELTLYTIAQNKKIEALERKVEKIHD